MKKNSIKNIVVILNYNSTSLTVKLVEDIHEYSNIYKILVVDNNSNLMNKEKLNILKSFSKVKILYVKENGGYAKGNNVALRYIKKEYVDIDNVIIANPDVHFSEETLNYMVQFTISKNDEKIGMVSPIMLLPNEKKEIKITGFRLAEYIDDLRLSSPTLTKFFGSPIRYKLESIDIERSYKKVDALPGSFFLMKFSAFSEIGFFDEYNFLYSEERTLGHKLKEKGYNSYNLLNCYFNHDHSQVIKNNVKKKISYFMLANSRINYQSKYNSINYVQKCLLLITHRLGWYEVKIHDMFRRKKFE
ncbi:glycosyltransferase [Enterococcus faecium]|uniref:glycosyltransferase n=1 Tax=Enterococcus TaxID=1350 RepID=UPI00028278BB|nr:glycosyltransferase [Enterococcus faecium]EJY48076.1 glycosyltransferase, group 2 family protein [Enterococcus faecium 504]